MVRKTCIAIGMLFFAGVAAAEFNWGASKLAEGGRLAWSYFDDYPIYSVAIPTDGNTALIGGQGTGAARVYTRSGGAWSRQADIPVGTDVGVGAPGTSVAISADGTTAIVGRPEDANGVGAAWVYTRSGNSWSQQGPKLVGSGASYERPFQGRSVALSADGNTAVVGGPWDGIGEGAAWVFTRSGGVWSQQGLKLQGTPSGATQPFKGHSVAISADGNTVVLGGIGDVSGTSAAWVFARSSGVWSQQGPMLVASGAMSLGFQGCPVAISADGNTFSVGGPNDASGIGAAWVYTRTGGVWAQQGPKLVGTGAVGNAGQGSSVATSADGNTLIVGGSSDDSGTGAAWVFTRSGGAWSQKGDKLVGSGAVERAYQGASVAISGDGATFLVGGPGDDAAWVFSDLVHAWVPVATHGAGLNGSEWRSDLGLLNPGAATANVQIQFHSRNGVVASSTSVPAGTQSILTDVVGQLGAADYGALEVVSDQPLKLTARTYSQTAPDAGCFPGGTHGQEYPVLAAGEGLGAGQSAYLPGLVENAAYRCNIGVLSTDSGGAAVLFELYDGAGTKLAEYTVGLAQGQWAQENQPFKNKAGQAAMDRGYAKVTVQSGSGVSAFASVIDNVTNDPTNVAMQR